LPVGVGGTWLKALPRDQWLNNSEAATM